MMHVGVGTTLGGVMTTAGEPQNLIITKAVGWRFGEFFIHMAPITALVMVCELLTCLSVGEYRLFSYGELLPSAMWRMLQDSDNRSRAQCSHQEQLRLLA